MYNNCYSLARVWAACAYINYKFEYAVQLAVRLSHINTIVYRAIYLRIVERK